MQIEWHPGDDELAGFIRSYLDSFCTWDILVYLAHVPDVVTTVDSLAPKVGRPAADVFESMERLTASGLLESSHEFGQLVYRLDGHEENRRLLKRFADHHCDEDVRTLALRWVISRRNGQSRWR